MCVCVSCVSRRAMTRPLVPPLQQGMANPRSRKLRRTRLVQPVQLTVQLVKRLKVQLHPRLLQPHRLRRWTVLL